MKILMDIGHPGHVHLLRNVYHILKDNGHQIWVIVKDIPIAKTLLDKYNIEYTVIGGKKNSMLMKVVAQIYYNIKVLQLVKQNKIELGIGSSITLTHVSMLSKMKCIFFDDDDDDVQPLVVKFAHPFIDALLSPESLIGHRKRKGTIFYAGFHELAYLHPNRFSADLEVLKEIGIAKDEVYFILRFNAFKAHHDIGVNGMSLIQKKELIRLLEPHGRIFITTEGDIEPEFTKYQIPVSPEKTHSLMYFATLFLGDSQTMTSEAAVLGTPAIRMNSLVGRIACLEEEEHKYGLTFGFKPNQFKEMTGKVEELLQTPHLKKEWNKKRNKLLSDKVDVTAFFLWFIENYPKSTKIIEEHPDYQYKFK